MNTKADERYDTNDPFSNIIDMHKRVEAKLKEEHEQ
jgi:hypothetical protein